MKEYGVQCRIYTNQGWAASKVHTRSDSLSPLYTKEQAEEAVKRYNNRCPADETGLPYARLVEREVSEWTPASI